MGVDVEKGSVKGGGGDPLRKADRAGAGGAGAASDNGSVSADEVRFVHSYTKVPARVLCCSLVSVWPWGLGFLVGSRFSRYFLLSVRSVLLAGSAGAPCFLPRCFFFLSFSCVRPPTIDTSTSDSEYPLQLRTGVVGRLDSNLLLPLATSICDLHSVLQMIAVASLVSFGESGMQSCSREFYHEGGRGVVRPLAP